MAVRDPMVGRGAAAAGAVVVGVDGSAGSLAALRWAVAEAAAHVAPVCVVHVLDPRGRRAPYAEPGRPGSKPAGEAAAVERVERLIDQVVRDARRPGEVRRLFEVGSPVDVLLKASQAARMLVLGHASSRRRETGDDLHESSALGPVVRGCAARAECPVVVVPAPARRSDESSPCTSEPAEPIAVPVEGVRTLYPRYRAHPMHR